MPISVNRAVLIVLLHTIGLVRAFSGNISISGNNVIGGNVMVTCRWNVQPSEVVFDLTIRPPNTSGINYYFSINAGATSPGSLRNETKHALDGTFNNQSVSMTISGLQCTDDQVYGCFFNIIIGGNPQYSNSTSHLDVKVRPRVPTINVSHMGTDILENTNITATCRANLGRYSRGGLRFMVYRNGNAENVPDTDPRIINRRNVTLNPGEEECSFPVERTFRMQVSSADQNLIVACFVTNLDFPVDPVPTTCDNPSLQFCNKTDTQRIVYGVSDSTLSLERSPGTDLYQGMNVTLTCLARGLPQPTYVWVRNGDDNSTQQGVTNSDGSSTLTLTNLMVDNGESFSCNASNTVLGIAYTASKQIEFIVFPTTTTTTTTTTTPTTTIKASTSTVPTAGTRPQNGGRGGDDSTTTIIIVVVVVGSGLIIALSIGVICWRKQRSKKAIKEPADKPYNNRTNPSYQSSQPDLVADNKKFNSTSLENVHTKSSMNGSIADQDGLGYADLTYDNKPRSRKPLALSDTSSDYSDLQSLPQV